MRFILIILLSFSFLLYLCEIDIRRHVPHLHLKHSRPTPRQSRIDALKKRYLEEPAISLMEDWQKALNELKELVSKVEEKKEEDWQKALDELKELSSKTEEKKDVEEPPSHTQQTLHELQKKAFAQGDDRSQRFLDTLQLLLAMKQDGILTERQMVDSCRTVMDRYTRCALDN